MILAPNPVLGHKKCDFVILVPKPSINDKENNVFARGVPKEHKSAKIMEMSEFIIIPTF